MKNDLEVINNEINNVINLNYIYFGLKDVFYSIILF